MRRSAEHLLHGNDHESWGDTSGPMIRKHADQGESHA